jgi:OmpA family.
MRRVEGSHDYWQSYSDMMAALLLMFALLVVLMMYKSSGVAEELNAQKEKVDDIIGIRASLINELYSEFKNSDMTIEIDKESGAIRFSEGIFFDKDKYILKPEGKLYLNEFMPKYISILLSPKFKPYISQIIIEGHTDQTGSYIYNLDLSQKRAYEVARYLLDTDIPGISDDMRDELKYYITANGRSFSEPILVNGEIDQDKSRRVEFKFRLKEEEMVKEMQNILEGSSQR